ncbi:hypothetical protein ACFFRR_006693 [Megaselia abdita]
MFSKALLIAIFGLFALSNAQLNGIPTQLFVNEAEEVAQLDAQVASYQVKIDSAQIRVQSLFAQMTEGNHEIFQSYINTANIFASLKQQNNTASQCVTQYGIVPAVGNFTNLTTTSVETTMKGYETTLDSLTNTMETAQNQILNMVETVENCFISFLTKQSKTMLNICAQTALATGSSQVIVTLNMMDAPIALITASVSVAEAGITTATSTYNAATNVALYNVYHCISPNFYKNGQLIINGSTIVVGTN